MALKFRRGTTAQQSGSLAFGEPYVNTTLGTLVIGGSTGDIVLSSAGTGSTGNFGAISGSGLDITGNANIAGNLTLGGAITIGDASADTVNVVASLSSSLIPSVTNAFDLGSETHFWRDLYVSTGSIKFVGAAGTVVGTLTNIGNGLNLDGGIVTKGNSTFGTSSLSTTIVTGSLLINGNVIVTNGGITGSIAATNGVVSGSSQIQFNTVNGTPFSQSTDSVTTSKHIIPTTLTVDLGSATKPFRDLYLSSASLYIDGTQVLSSNATELIFSTDVGQSIKFNELGTDNIVLQTLDGDIELKSSGGGDITLDPTNGLIGVRGTLQIQDTHKITSSGGTKVVIGNDLEVTGSITSNGSITGTSFNGTINATNGVVSGSSQVNADSITNFDTNVKDKLNADGVISGSSQVVLSSTTGFSTYSTSVDSRILTEKGRVDAILSASTADVDTFAEVVALINSVDTTNDASFASFFTSSTGRLNNLESTSGSVNISVSNLNIFSGSVLTRLTEIGVVSGSLISSASAAKTTNDSQDVSITNINTFTGSANTRLGLLETSTGSLNSFTSSINTTIKSKLDTDGVVSGSSQITYASISSIPAGIVSGSSQVNLASVTGNSTTNVTEGTNLYFTDARVKTKLDAETVVSGSSQITAGSTTGFATGVKTQLDANTVVSGSSQINVASTTGDIELGTRTSGNYVASLVAGTNITLTNNTGEGATPTIGLTNNTISGIALGSDLATLTIGTGLSGTSYNGSGAVTIANTGVTSNVAGTGVTVSGATGAVTISIGQAVATSSNVQFNSLGVGMAASATAGRIDATNDVVAFSSSDIRFKENIKPIENAIDKIRKISGNTYDWKEENKIEHGYEGNDVGVIAQEIEAVLPQLVQTRESGFKAVKYDKLVALLIEGIKEQQLQIEQLRIDLDNCRNNKGL